MKSKFLENSMKKEKSFLVTVIAVLVKYKKYLNFFKKYISMMIKMTQSRETDILISNNMFSLNSFSKTKLIRLLKILLHSFRNFVFTFVITFLANYG